jgi:plasmid maintenance system antidote protein VapI
MKLTSGAILRAFMDERKVSNNDVALAAGVGRTFISALVNGRRSSCTPQVAARIERFLGVPEGVLFVARTSAVSGRQIKKEAA